MRPRACPIRCHRRWWRAAHATRVERPPWEAQIPFDILADARFPKLVFTGGHNAAFDAVADVLAERLPAERSVIQGSGHSVQRTGEPFNARLRAFIVAAEPPPIPA